jgi:hypothetical protein
MAGGEYEVEVLPRFTGPLPRLLLLLAMEPQRHAPPASILRDLPVVG